MKYFLALFCIMNTSFVSAMNNDLKNLDPLDKKLLMHYLKMNAKGVLNEGGVSIATKRTPEEVTLFFTVDDTSKEKAIVSLLRRSLRVKTMHTESSYEVSEMPQVDESVIKTSATFTCKEFDYYVKALEPEFKKSKKKD